MRRVLLGFNRRMIPIPWFVFRRILQREAKKTKRVILQPSKTSLIIL
jgi:hypothetical protein